MTLQVTTWINVVVFYTKLLCSKYFFCLVYSHTKSISSIWRWWPLEADKVLPALCLTRREHLTWYSIQSHYPVTGPTSHETTYTYLCISKGAIPLAFELLWFVAAWDRSQASCTWSRQPLVCATRPCFQNLMMHVLQYTYKEKKDHPQQWEINKLLLRTDFDSTDKRESNHSDTTNININLILKSLSCTKLINYVKS